MNPLKERNYGILWNKDKSYSYYYLKNENDWTRFALFGEVVEYEIDDKPPPDNPSPEDYEIQETVRLKEPLRMSALSPVYSRIGGFIKEHLRRKAIRDAIVNGSLETDFDGPPIVYNCLKRIFWFLFGRKTKG